MKKSYFFILFPITNETFARIYINIFATHCVSKQSDRIERLEST